MFKGFIYIERKQKRSENKQKHQSRSINKNKGLKQIPFFPSEIAGLLITLFFPLCVNSQCESIDMFVAYTYQQTGHGLTQVPLDIPAEATWVRLDNNQISVIPPAAFSNLTSCTVLWLSGNILIHVRADIFESLSSAASILHTLHFFCPVILCSATVRCVGLNGLNEKGGSL